MNTNHHIKKILILIFLIIPLISQAQFNVLDKVKDKVNQRADQKVDKSIDKGLDKAEDAPKSGNKDNNKNSKDSNKNSDDKSSSNSTTKPADIAQYGKYDFVPGTRIIFEDDISGESLGEFPSKWQLGSGKIEIASLNGENVIAFLEGNYATIYPYWKNDSDYLPDVFTIEFDHYVKPGGYLTMEINLHNAQAGAKYEDGDIFSGYFSCGNSAAIGPASGSDPDPEYAGKWHHIAISYNNGNVKIYTDQHRLCNAPRVKGNPHSLFMGCIGSSEGTIYIKNIRIAEGGGDLYKRVMSDGKIISRGILFDVNKATIKPQSMGAINEVSQLMKDHNDIKFEIDGHTDADGDDASNLKLSQQRADAVKTQLVSMGIDSARLTTKGYGETKSVDNNSTPEGKANNRRVEFVKM